jgi:HTH-type transcriptional regulator/antitoxin HigA
MIKNEKQYKITKKKLNGIIQKIEALQLEADQSGNKKELILISLTDVRTDMEAEVAEYEFLKSNKTNILKARSISELPSLITEYKIASGLTQKEFSKQIGMKEQQLQRYEAEAFKSISFKNLLKLLQAIGLDLVVNDATIGKVSKKEPAGHRSIT